MFPGRVDHPAVGIDVGRSFAGQLVVLGVVGAVHAGVARAGVEARLDALDDQVLGVDLTRADVSEGRSVLPLEILMRVGIIPPDDAVLRDRYAGPRNGAHERHVRVRRGDVIVEGWQRRLRRVRRDPVGPGYDVVRGVAIRGPVHVVVHVGVVIDHVGPLPDLAEDVIIGTGAIDHAAVHLLQLHRDQAAASYRPDQAGWGMPVDGAQPRDAEFADVLVDHVGLLHAGLRPDRRLRAVLDLDDDRRP